MTGATASAAEHPEHQLAVFLFTDILDSSGLKVRLGDFEYATRIAQPHNQIFRAILARFPDGREIGYTGDGFAVMFGSIVSAVETALLFHHALRLQKGDAGGIQVRVGIHLGQTVILSDQSEQLAIASHAADMCSRLMSLALGGQTLLTRNAFDDARQYVRAHPPLPEGGEPPELEWAAHGAYLFKGRADPIEVFEVGAVGFAPLTPPPDVEKARRAIRPGDEETLGWRPAQGVEIPGRPGWHVVERLGEGGFGEVWLAAHGKLKERRVFKFCFDEARLRSFKRELTFFRLIRDALGERRDIARLYDVKVDAPPFFLESEFAAHGNLVQWCERQGGAGAVPLARRLDIAARVADAVAAAHSIGILHKDIKPQNVLMQACEGGEDTPQLTDFGIGALADDEALASREITAVGFTVNTLTTSSSSGMTRLYAPPEQLTGKPFTVQGDIFALGVMLYQLVAGDFERALAAGWERDVEDPLLREDIAACVDGEPARRLQSASALATRLRSLEERRAEAAREREKVRLEEELATTRAHAAAERERLRRTRRIATVIGILAIVAVAAGFSAQREKVKAQRAEATAEQQRTHADEEREAALAARKQAEEQRHAAEEARKKAVAEKAAADELIQYMQYDLHERLSGIGQLSIMEGVNARVRKYREEHAGAVADPHAERERSIALSQRGDLLFDRGQLAEALAAFRERLAITEKLTALDPANTQWERDHASSLIKVGNVLRAQGKPADALKAFQSSLAISESMVKRTPEAGDPQFDLALSCQKLGEACRDLRQVDEALKWYQQSKEIRERGVQRYPMGTAWQTALANSERKLGEMLREAGRLDEALAEFRGNLAIRETLAQKDRGSAASQALLGWAHGRIGDVLFDQGKSAEALASFREDLAIRERLAKLDPTNAGWIRDLASAHGRLGEVAMKQERWADAVAEFRSELEIARPWVQRPNAEVAWVDVFGKASGNCWASLRPGGAPAERASARADLRTALEALNNLKKTGRLAAPLDTTLEWLAALDQAAGAEGPDAKPAAPDAGAESKAN